MEFINLGERFKIAQDKTGKTTQKICTELQVTRQQVHRWRTANDMLIHKAQRFANYFEMSLQEFLGL